MEETTSFSDWQKKTVPTFIVSSRDQGHGHITLQETIDKAQPYSKIVLQSGMYTENLTISKPIEIVGDTGDEPLIQAKGPVVTIFGDIECYLASLKIRVRSLIAGTVSAGRGEPPAVQITNGRPFIEKCEISSVHCSGASNAIIEKCYIVGNRTGSGLQIRDVASGEFRNNEITNHAYYAVEIISRGTPYFELNDIHCRHDDPDSIPGVGLVKIGGLSNDPKDIRPVFENNRVVDYYSESQKASGAFFKTNKGPNAPPEKEGGGSSSGGKKSISATEMRAMRAAISIDCASPKMSEMTVEGGVISIMLTNKSGGQIRDSTIASSLLCGIFADKGADTVVRTTKILHSCGGGAFLDSCSVLFSECSVSMSKGPGVTVKDCPHAGFEHSYVEKNKSGIALSGLCNGVLSSNHIMNNGLYGIRCTDPGCKPKLKENTVLVNGPVGIHIQNGSEPKMTTNTVCGSQIGLVVDTAGCPVVVENTFSKNEQVNILVEKNGKGIFEDNHLVGSNVASVKVVDGGHPLFANNEVIECSGCGILVTEGGIGEFKSNKLRNHGDGFHVAFFADPIFHNNEVSNCSRYGAVVDEEGVGTFTYNKFSQNNIGIACINGGEGTFRANDIINSVTHGGVMGEGSTALIEKNFFNSSGSNNLLLSGANCDCTVVYNTFRNAVGVGVLAEKSAQGTVTYNKFSGNRTGGMGTETKGDAVFEDNGCYEDKGPGILCTNGGLGTFRNNSVEQGISSGCVIASSASPLVEACEFNVNGAHGVDLRHGALGTVKDCIAQGNGIGGLQFTGDCKTKVVNFKTHGNGEQGVGVADSAVCYLENCESFNQPIGIKFFSCGASVVTKCKFYDNDIGAMFQTNGVGKLENCVFKNHKDASIEFNDQGNGTVSDCTVQGGKVGIRSKNRGGGTVRRVDVSDCAAAGAHMDLHACTNIQECTFTGCKVGVSCNKNSNGKVSESNIHHNRSANVSAEAHAATIFHKNKIAHCEQGFNVDCFGDIEMSSNTIEHGALGGIYLGTYTHAKFVENDVSRNSQHGVVCGERSEAELRKNEITGNELCGVKMEKVAACRLIENKIHHNKVLGIFCAPNSGGMCEKNEVSSNGFANARLMVASTTTFGSNNFISGEPYGVVVEGGSNRFELNTFQQHRAAAIYIVGQSVARFEKNFVFSNATGVILEKNNMNRMLMSIPDETVRQLGTHVGPRRNSEVPISTAAFVTGTDLLEGGGDHHDGSPNSKKQRLSPESSATFVANDFYRNKGTGMMLESGSNPHINANVFHDDDTAISITSGAKGKIENNNFKDNMIGMTVAGNNICTKIQQNVFEHNQFGVEFSGNRDGVEELTVVENRFIRSKTCGIKLSAESAVALAHNDFKDDAAGIIADTGAKGSATSNTFSGCKVGVHLLTRTNMYISRNHFAQGNELGVLSSDGSGDVFNNVFSNSDVAGVCIEAHGSCKVYKNLFAHNDTSDTTAGVLCRDGGNAEVYENDFHENAIGVRAIHCGTSNFKLNFMHDNSYGVYCATGSTPNIVKCSLSQNKKADVFSCAGGKPNVSLCLFHNTFCAFQIENRGGGIFSRNIVRDCEGSAVSIELDSLRRMKEDDEIGSNRSSISTPMEGTLLGGLGTATVSQVDKPFTTNSRSNSGSSYDATPTFSENYVTGAAIGIELDCGTKYNRKKRRSSVGAGVLSSELSQQFSEDLSATKRVTEFIENQRKSSITSESGSPILERMRSRHRFDHREYRSPMPDLAALIRPAYHGFISSNVIVNCQQGVVVRNGPVVPLPQLEVLSGYNEYGIPPAISGAFDSDPIGELGGKLEGRRSTEGSSDKDQSEEGRRSGANSAGPSGSGPNNLKVSTAFKGIGSRGPSPLPTPSGFFERKNDDDDQDFDDEDDTLPEGVMPVPANDLLQMVMFENNTISGCEWGITCRAGGSARFQRNFIQKGGRGGIMITDEGRGEFIKNVIRDCGGTGILISSGGADGMRGPQSGSASPTGPLPCYANFQENLIVGHKNNLAAAAGEIRFYKNVLHSGDMGMHISNDSAIGLYEGNIAFNNRRGGCIVNCEHAVLVANFLYSPADQGALDVRCDNFRLPQGNTVKNQFTPRWNKRDPARKFKVPAEVSEKAFGQTQADLFATLRSLHEGQLPQCGFIGCTKIGAENSLLAVVSTLRMAGKISAQVVVPSVPAVEPEPTTPAQKRIIRRKTQAVARKATAFASVSGKSGDDGTSAFSDDSQLASSSKNKTPKTPATKTGLQVTKAVAKLKRSPQTGALRKGKSQGESPATLSLDGSSGPGKKKSVSIEEEISKRKREKSDNPAPTNLNESLLSQMDTEEHDASMDEPPDLARADTMAARQPAAAQRKLSSSHIGRSSSGSIIQFGDASVLSPKYLEDSHGPHKMGMPPRSPRPPHADSPQKQALKMSAFTLNVSDVGMEGSLIVRSQNGSPAAGSHGTPTPQDRSRRASHAHGFHGSGSLRSTPQHVDEEVNEMQQSIIISTSTKKKGDGQRGRGDGAVVGDGGQLSDDMEESTIMITTSPKQQGTSLGGRKPSAQDLLARSDSAEGSKILNHIHQKRGTKYGKDQRGTVTAAAQAMNMSGGFTLITSQLLAPRSVSPKSSPGSTPHGRSRSSSPKSSQKNKGFIMHQQKIAQRMQEQQHRVEVAEQKPGVRSPAFVALDPDYVPKTDNVVLGISPQRTSPIVNEHEEEKANNIGNTTHDAKKPEALGNDVFFHSVAASKSNATAGDSKSMHQFNLAAIPLRQKKEGAAEATVQSLKMKQLVQSARRVGENVRMRQQGGGESPGHGTPRHYGDFIALPSVIGSSNTNDRSPRQKQRFDQHSTIGVGAQKQPTRPSTQPNASRNVPSFPRLGLDDKLSGKGLRTSPVDQSLDNPQSTDGDRGHIPPPPPLPAAITDDHRDDHPQGVSPMPLELDAKKGVSSLGGSSVPRQKGRSPRKPERQQQAAGAMVPRRPHTQETSPSRRKSLFAGGWHGGPSDEEDDVAYEAVGEMVPVSTSTSLSATRVGRVKVNAKDVPLGRFKTHGAIDRFVPWTTMEKPPQFAFF